LSLHAALPIGLAVGISRLMSRDFIELRATSDEHEWKHQPRHDLSELQLSLTFFDSHAETNGDPRRFEPRRANHKSCRQIGQLTPRLDCDASSSSSPVPDGPMIQAHELSKCSCQSGRNAYGDFIIHRGLSEVLQHVIAREATRQNMRLPMRSLRGASPPRWRLRTINWPSMQIAQRRGYGRR
jgi:hypothetical protein